MTSGPISPLQQAAIARVIGPNADEQLVRAVRDARGRTFQRLEFLGDPLLESIEGLVAMADGGRISHHEATTDAALAAQARRLGVDDWLEWSPSTQRLADLVEAIAGAGYVAGGWKQVGDAFARMHGPLPPDVVRLLKDVHREPTAAPSPEIDRATASLGASMLETAATVRVYSAAPEADEGELSALRRELHLTAHIATWASSRGWSHPSREDSVLSDLVETWIGRIALTDGVAAAVRQADQVLVEGRSLSRG